MTIIIFYAPPLSLSLSALKALSGKMIDETSACVHNLPLNKAPLHTHTHTAAHLDTPWPIVSWRKKFSSTIFGPN